MTTRLLRRRNRLVHFSTRRLIASGSLALAGWGAAAQAGDLTAALDAAPAGAEFVLVVPSLQDASDAVADLAELFGADDPEVLDLLGSFKREMGITAGLDDDGSAVIVLAGLAEAIADNSEPEPIVLLPVSDYAAFVESIGGSSGGVSSVMLEGDDGFAKQLGDFAVLGENQATIEAYAAGNAGAALLERVGRYGAEDAEDAAMAGFIDVAAIRPALLEQIDAAMDGIKQQMTRDMARAAQSPVDPQSMAALMDSYGNLGRVLLKGVDAGMFSWNYGGDGLEGGYAWDVVEGSQLASYLTNDRADFAGLLDQMPASPYIFAVAMDTTAIDVAGMSTDMVEAVTEAMADEPMFAGIMAMVKESLTIYEQMNSAAQVFYAPDMAALMGGGFMKTLSIYEVDDTDATIEAVRASWANLPGLIPAMMEQLPDGQQAPPIDFTFDWTENSLTLDGVDVHQYDLKLELPPQLMAELGPAAMMMGNAGTSGYIAGIDGKVIVTTVSDPQLMTEGIDAVKNGGGLGAADAVGEAREALPEGAVMEMFVSLDGIAEAVNPFMMMFAGGMQLEVPEDISPIAMGLGTEGTAMGAKVVVPTSALTFLRDTIEQAEALNQQQRGGGGGPGRAPF